MRKIRVQTLGTAIIEAGTTRVTPISPRSFALLLYLSAVPGGRVRRATLWELIYPDKSLEHARHSLRELTYQFRLARIPVETDRDGIALPAKSASNDYTRLILAGRPTVEQLDAAQGGFLPGYAPDHSEAFSEWFDEFRARVTFALCKTLLKEVARARAAADWRATDRATRACLALGDE